MILGDLGIKPVYGDRDVELGNQGHMGAGVRGVKDWVFAGRGEAWGGWVRTDRKGVDGVRRACVIKCGREVGKWGFVGRRGVCRK